MTSINLTQGNTDAVIEKVEETPAVQSPSQVHELTEELLDNEVADCPILPMANPTAVATLRSIRRSDVAWQTASFDNTKLATTVIITNLDVNELALVTTASTGRTVGDFDIYDEITFANVTQKLLSFVIDAPSCSKFGSAFAGGIARFICSDGTRGAKVTGGANRFKLLWQNLSNVTNMNVQFKIKLSGPVPPAQIIQVAISAAGAFPLNNLYNVAYNDGAIITIVVGTNKTYTDIGFAFADMNGQPLLGNVEIIMQVPSALGKVTDTIDENSLDPIAAQFTSAPVSRIAITSCNYRLTQVANVMHVNGKIAATITPPCTTFATLPVGNNNYEKIASSNNISRYENQFVKGLHAKLLPPMYGCSFASNVDSYHRPKLIAVAVTSLNDGPLPAIHVLTHTFQAQVASSGVGMLTTKLTPMLNETFISSIHKLSCLNLITENPSHAKFAKAISNIIVKGLRNDKLRENLFGAMGSIAPRATSAMRTGYNIITSDKAKKAGKLIKEGAQNFVRRRRGRNRGGSKRNPGSRKQQKERLLSSRFPGPGPATEALEDLKSLRVTVPNK